MEKYSCYEFKILPNENVWIYHIYGNEYKNDVIRESDEWYESEQEARIAAIDHIDALESGER